jgi:hypothetical protein
MQQQLSRITNLQDVNRILHDVMAKERACDAELVRLLMCARRIAAVKCVRVCACVFGWGG